MALTIADIMAATYPQIKAEYDKKAAEWGDAQWLQKLWQHGYLEKAQWDPASNVQAEFMGLNCECGSEECDPCYERMRKEEEGL